MAEIRSVIAIVILFMLAGCGTEKAVVNDSTKEFLTSLEFQSSLASTKQEIASKNDQILHAVGEQSKAITTLTKTLEASLVKSETATGTEVIKSAQDPAQKSPAAETNSKASSGQGLPQSETLVQLATRLYAQGVNTHMKTREQLEAIDAQLNGGAPVTGAIFPNNRAAAVTSQRTTFRSVPQRVSFFGRTKYSNRQSCPSGRCPQR